MAAPGSWEGEGAAAFKAAVAELDPQFELLVGACRQASSALSTYAGALATAQGDAARLTSDAAAQHFEVDDQGGVRYTGPPVIEDPNGSDTLAATQQRLEQEAQRILQEAETAAETAKGQIDDARMSLVGPYKVSWPWENPIGAAGYVFTAYTSAASAQSLARTELSRLEGPRNEILRKLANASSPKKARHWEKLLERYDREVSSDLRANLRGTMQAADKASERYLPFSKQIGVTLGDVSGSAGPLSKVLAVRGIRNVPLVGIGLTAVQGGWNVAHGAEPTEEITADSASLVAGALVADLATTGTVAAMTALGVTAVGAAPILVGLAAGVAVAWGVGEGVHWLAHT